ncbi:heterokaryon incompatibility protein-domain-containing protein, partial [Lophiotrema nucula]
VPRRLLDVGEPHSNARIRLRLRNTRDIPESTLLWCTLSHCWGKAEILRLTEANMSALMEEVSPSELPQTFQEAVEVTRALGIRYLWIDSLCIIQDPPNGPDWLQEGVKMHGIYKGSFCTIAASASTDANKGLFRFRDLSLLCPIEVSLNRDEAMPRRRLYRLFRKQNSYVVSRVWGHLASQHLKVQPLNSRAWVCQERYLSPQTLHFSSQLYYESKDCFLSETYPNKSLDLDQHDRMFRQSFDFRHAMIQSLAPSRFANKFYTFIRRKPRKEIWSSWHRVVEQNMACDITRPSDRLIAIGALAKVWKSASQSEYLAGLWKGNLVYDLMWVCRPLSNTGSAEFIAPSWSWARVSGGVSFGRELEEDASVPLIDIVDTEIDLVGDDEMGQVSYGVIELRGI